MTHPALLPDGSVGRVVEIDLADGAWPDGATRARYVLPARDVDPFLAAVSAATDAAEADRFGRDRPAPAGPVGRPGRGSCRGVGGSHRMGGLAAACRG